MVRTGIGSPDNGRSRLAGEGVRWVCAGLEGLFAGKPAPTGVGLVVKVHAVLGLGGFHRLQHRQQAIIAVALQGIQAAFHQLPPQSLTAMGQGHPFTRAARTGRFASLVWLD